MEFREDILLTFRSIMTMTFQVVCRSRPPMFVLPGFDGRIRTFTFISLQPGGPRPISLQRFAASLHNTAQHASLRATPRRAATLRNSTQRLSGDGAATKSAALRSHPQKPAERAYPPPAQTYRPPDPPHGCPLVGRDTRL
jgi:hypothetical protein